jgi:hypothetical protein
MKKKKLAPGFQKKAQKRPPKKKGGMSQFYKKWDPLQPIRGKTAKREVNAATRLEFDPQKRQLQGEMLGSDRRQGEIDSWYANYQNEVARLRGEAQGAYDKAAGAITSLSQQNASQDAANQRQISDQARQDAELRGATYDDSGSKTAAAAANARQNLLATVHGTVQGQGANQYAHMTNRQAIAGTSQREAKDAEYKRRWGLDQDARELAKKEGDFRVDFLRTLREDERRYQVEKAASKVDKYEARTDRKKAKETARSNRAGEKIDLLEEQGRNKRNTQDEKGQNKRNKADNEAARKKQEDKQRFDKKENQKDRRADKKKNRKRKV